jgi:hypothetical protein
MRLPVAQGVYFLLTGGRISKIYLADAVIEGLLVGLWGRGRRRRLIS